MKYGVIFGFLFILIGMSYFVQFIQFVLGAERILKCVGTYLCSGTQRDDLMIGDNASNIMTGVAGTDVMMGSIGDDAMSGGNRSDQMIGDEGAYKISGGDGSD